MAPVGMASKESTQKLEKAMLSASIVCEVSFLDLDMILHNPRIRHGEFYIQQF